MSDTPETTAPAVDAVPQSNQIQVDVDYLRTTRVHICMPCYGGMLTEQTFMSFIKWGNTCRQLGIDWTVETMTNESLISRARNTLTAKFLSNPESTHLMFIDADIGWEPWHLLVMLNRRVDVIGGLYPMKSLPVKWCVNGIPGQPEGADGLVEVTKTGTGFMLIKRDVFEKLDQHPAVRPFNNDIGLDAALNTHMKTYFDTAVRENRYYSEDWTFCENWRDLGGHIYIDKRVLLRHVGTYVFDGNTQQQLYQDLGAMFAPQTPAPAVIQPEIVAASEPEVMASSEDSPAPETE
jgi:hypothetical protein